MAVACMGAGRCTTATGCAVARPRSSSASRPTRRPACPPPGPRAAATTVPLTEQQRKILIALCRPAHDSAAATPATNRQIADEVFLSVDAVKAHLRVLFDRFGMGELPQNEKRARLAAQVLLDRVVAPNEF